MAQTLKYAADEIDARLGGNFGSDDVRGRYHIGTWLQTTAATDLGSAPKRIPVLDPSGWLYYRTLEELQADLGVASSASGLSYGICDTEAATQEKTVTLQNSTEFELSEGASIRVKFTYAQTYNGQPTLNVNETGAKPIVRNGTTAGMRYMWVAGEVLDLVFDGTNYIAVDSGIATTTYYGVTKLSSSLTSTSTSLAASAAAVGILHKSWGTFTLTASGWSSSLTDGYYTQQITVTGMKASYYPDMIPVFTSAANAEIERDAIGMIYEIETYADYIIARCLEKPTVDITFMLQGA